jgi:hypothetical protein
MRAIGICLAGVGRVDLRPSRKMGAARGESFRPGRAAFMAVCPRHTLRQAGQVHTAGEYDRAARRAGQLGQGLQLLEPQDGRVSAISRAALALARAAATSTRALMSEAWADFSADSCLECAIGTRVIRHTSEATSMDTMSAWRLID